MRGERISYALFLSCALYFAPHHAAQGSDVIAKNAAIHEAAPSEFFLAMGDKPRYPELPPPPAEGSIADEPPAPTINENMLGEGDHEHMHDAIPADVVLQTRARAEGGDANAQGVMGELYHKGMGVERDLRKAFYWFRLGAEQEDPTSMLYLARYYMGEFPSLQINKDYDEAEKWLVKMAQQGDVPAMATLGNLLYQRAHNGETDRLEEAAWWYNRATGGAWNPDFVPKMLRESREDTEPPPEESARQSTEQGDLSAVEETDDGKQMQK